MRDEMLVAETGNVYSAAMRTVRIRTELARPIERQILQQESTVYGSRLADPLEFWRTAGAASR